MKAIRAIGIKIMGMGEKDLPDIPAAPPLMRDQLVVEARIRYSARGITGPGSYPEFFKPSSLLELIIQQPNFRVELTGERRWLN